MSTKDLLTSVKAVPMPRVLAGLGVMPVRRAVADAPALYRAPYRQDNHPSMSVYQHNGEWLFKDHATGDYGTNIDLLIRMGVCSGWRDAMQYIAGYYLVTGVYVHPATTTAPVRDIEPSKAIPQTKRCVILSVEPIEGSPAERYVTDIRRIPMDIASRYLSFIRYTFDGTKVLSGIGWPTVSGGWSVRWPVDLGPGKGKGFVGRGGPSLFLANAEGRTAECDVFEGIFDFLSFMAMKELPQQNDAIVLNSAENIKAAIPLLKDYDLVNAYMDHDAAGNAAMNTLKLNCLHEWTDRSKIYEGYKDMNDFLKQLKTKNYGKNNHNF